MGGAQPLAAVMAGASLSCRRMPAVAHRDAAAYTLSRPPGQRSSTKRWRSWRRRAATANRSRSACSAMPPRFFPSWCGAACARTSVTDQTSAHDPVNGYLPKGWTTGEWEARRETDPKGVASAARASMAEHVRAMLDFHRMGIPVVDYGNNIRQMALEEGVKDAFDFPGLRAGLYQAAVLPRHRSVSLGGAVRRSRGYLPHRRQGQGTAAGSRAAAPLARHGARAHCVPGPAGADLLGRARRPSSPRPCLQRDGGAAAN